MKIRIFEIKGKIFFNVNLIVPKGVRIIAKEFNLYISLAIYNAISSIVYSPEEWHYIGNSPFIEINIGEKIFYANISKDQIKETFQNFQKDKGIVIVNFLYQ